MSGHGDEKIRECSNCGSQNVVMQEGISKKNGKPWRGYKCFDCKNMDFVKTEGHTQAPAPAPKKIVLPSVDNLDDRKVRSMAMSYAKDVVVAKIEAGLGSPNPYDELIFQARRLSNELLMPGSEKLGVDAL